MNWKGLEGRGSGLFQLLLQHLLGKTETNHMKTSLRIADALSWVPPKYKSDLFLLLHPVQISIHIALSGHT